MVNTIILTVFLVAIFVCIAIIIVELRRYRITYENQALRSKLDTEWDHRHLDQVNQADYTKAALELIQLLVTQQVTLEMDQYFESHVPTKITRQQMLEIMKRTANTVNDHFMLSRLNVTRMLVDNDFLTQFIIHMVGYSIRKSLKTHLGDDYIVE